MSLLLLYLQRIYVITGFQLYWLQQLRAKFLMNATQHNVRSQNTSYVCFQNEAQGHHGEECKINISVSLLILKILFVSSSSSFSLLPDSFLWHPVGQMATQRPWDLRSTVSHLIAVQWLWSYLFYLSFISFINELVIPTDNFT